LHEVQFVAKSTQVLHVLEHYSQVSPKYPEAQISHFTESTKN